MSFIDDVNDSKFQRKSTEFFDFTPGEHKVRVLDGKAHAERTHWIKNYRIKCLGDECPICAEDPNDYPRKAYFVNVLDLTKVKECPSCGKVTKASMGKFPKICLNCEQPLIEVKEKTYNKVVVLTGGKRLFVDQLNALYNEYGDLRNYDLDLLVTGVGRERQIIAKPSKEPPTEFEVDDDLKYDLTSVVITLTADEIVRLKSENIGLSEIYQARNKTEEPAKTDSEKVNKAIKDLFSD